MDTPETSASDQPPVEVTRRDFTETVSTAAMAFGLVVSYGTFVAWAGRFLFPNGSPLALFFVSEAEGIAPGGSFFFQSPGGLDVVITRSAKSADKKELTSEDFLALSSVCPHLGCRVHWEPHNDRFFCPCHNGVFNPQGKAIAGPPADANQELPKYPLLVDAGLLYIQMPAETVGQSNVTFSTDG